MDPIETLRHEHQAVRTALALLSLLRLRLTEPGRLDIAADADALLEFFKVFVDKCHHGKEERLLFPLLEKLGMGKEVGPIGVMLHEHEQGRAAIRGMTSALERYKEGDPKAAADFSVHAYAYADMLDRHIDKENNVLFVLAERHLSVNQLEGLERDFVQLENDEIGRGRHEAFQALLANLAKTYTA